MGNKSRFWRRRRTNVCNYISLYYIIFYYRVQKSEWNESSQQYSSGGWSGNVPAYVLDVIWNWHSLRRCRRNPEPPRSRSRIAPGGGNKRRVVTASQRYLCAENISRQHRCEKAVSFRPADLTLSLFPPTTVCTMCGLCVRKLLTVWKTSRRPSAFTRSRMLLRAMKVPVRPAPALQRKDGNSHERRLGPAFKRGKKKRACCTASSERSERPALFPPV